MIEDHANTFLRLPCIVRPIVKVGDMVCRFITVDVTANDAVASDVFGLGEELVRQMHVKKLIEMLRESFLPTHRSDHAVDVMRNIKTVVPGIPLNEALALG